MGSAGHALEQALAYYRAPALLAVAAQRPLPDDVIELLRLAAGDALQATQSAEASGESSGRVVEAAVFFVQQVMFAADAGPHRVLGVNPDAPADRIREHYRWLIRWLHPDRNADDWDSVYADRVTRAWQSLRRSGALAGEGEAGDIDSEIPVRRSGETPAVTPGVLAAAQLARLSREAQADEPILSARTARQLPAFVLGGLGLAAVSLVALIWYAQQNPPRRHALAAIPGSAQPAQPTDPATPAEPAPPDETLATVPTVPAPGAATSVPMLSDQPPEALPGSQSNRIGTEVAPTEALDAPAAELAVIPASRPVPEPAPTPMGATSVPIARTPAPPPPPPRPESPPPPPTPVAGSSVAPPAAQIAAAPAERIGTDAPPAAGRAAGIEQASAHAVLGKFSTAYAAGDINALMRLFTRDAVNNRGGREAIAFDYQSLFSQTRERRLDLAPNGWITRDNGAVVLADYEAWIKEGRLFPGTTTRGVIRFTLRREDGELKISQVIHD